MYTCSRRSFDKYCALQNLELHIMDSSVSYSFAVGHLKKFVHFIFIFFLSISMSSFVFEFLKSQVDYTHCDNVMICQVICCAVEVVTCCSVNISVVHGFCVCRRCLRLCGDIKEPSDWRCIPAFSPASVSSERWWTIPAGTAAVFFC